MEEMEVEGLIEGDSYGTAVRADNTAFESVAKSYLADRFSGPVSLPSEIQTRETDSSLKGVPNK